MAVRGGKKVSDITRGGLRLRSLDAFRDAVLFFDQVNTAPTTTAGIYSLYVNSDADLIFNDGTTTHNLVTGLGGGGNLTLNDALITVS